MVRPVVVAIAGCSGSGKTTLAKALLKKFEGKAIILNLDSYYKEFLDLSLEEVKKLDFDNPEQMDLALARLHILDLKHGKTINKPKYSFVTYKRLPETELIESKRIIIVEGLYALRPELRDVCDIKMFVNTPLEFSIIRCMERDIGERGRSPEFTCWRLRNQCIPGYYEWVAPTKHWAHYKIDCSNWENLSVDHATMIIRSVIE